MGLISWLIERFGGTAPLNPSQDIIAEYEDIVADIYVRELALWNSINLIANAVSKCEIKTFTLGKEVKEREYYLWNYEPNKNQNSSVFMHKLISQLYLNNECLVIDQDGQLLVADAFQKTPYALYGDRFTQVRVGDFMFAKTFEQADVLYFRLAERDMRKVIDGLYQSYARLLAYSMKSYQKSRGLKGVFKYDTIPVAGTDQRAAFDSLINEKFKTFLEANNGVIPLAKGQEFTEVSNRATYSQESSRDIRAMIDDVCDFTAKAIGIPPALLRGDVQGTKDALDHLLTFCIDPLVDQLAEEINRKRIGYRWFSQGSYIQIDTKAIKHVDLLSVSTAIDKLISSGVFCVNDIRRIVGEPPIEEDWANEHFITRNYMPFEEALKIMKGGESGENDLGS